MYPINVFYRNNKLFDNVENLALNVYISNIELHYDITSIRRQIPKQYNTHIMLSICRLKQNCLYITHLFVGTVDKNAAA